MYIIDVNEKKMCQFNPPDSLRVILILLTQTNFVQLSIFTITLPPLVLSMIVPNPRY